MTLKSVLEFELCPQRLPWKSSLRGLERGRAKRSDVTSPFPCSQAKLAVLLVTLVVATTSYLLMEQKLQQGLVPRQPRIPKPQHKLRGYRYLEEDNSDESDVDGGGGEQGQGDCVEEEAPQAGALGTEPAGPCRRPCPFEQALGGDGTEEH